MDENARYALILAAGKGTRFKSDTPKVLHPLCGRPIITYLLEKLSGLNLDRIFVVVGHEKEEVQAALSGYEVEYVIQEEQRGTGHAVMVAQPSLEDLSGSLIVLYGDTVLVEKETLESLFSKREQTEADQVLLTMNLGEPGGYGRIIRDQQGRIQDIVEERDASPEQRQLSEINPGFYCFKISSLLGGLSHLSNDNRAGEYYLTDMVRIFLAQEKQVETLTISSQGDELGINDRIQLAAVEKRLRSRINLHWMENGVTLRDPETVYIDSQVEIGPDTVVYPGVILEGSSKIGPGCTIHAHSHLRNTSLAEGVVVDHCSVIRESDIGPRTRIGPFAHLRMNVQVGADARIGNFVEVKKSRIASGTKAAHLSYLGDAELGSRVNVGAGTITCNYDGTHKHRTVIEDEVFIGSNSQLIAPVTIGRGSYVAAGSTITEEVPPGSLAIARSRQVVKQGWAERSGSKSQKAENA